MTTRGWINHGEMVFGLSFIKEGNNKNGESISIRKSMRKQIRSGPYLGTNGSRASENLINFPWDNFKSISVLNLL